METKFRGWNGTEMVYDILILIEGNGKPKWLDTRLEGTEKGSWVTGRLFQYTGVKDSKGVEVYEGSVISFNGRNYEVVSHDSSFGIKTLDSSSYLPFFDMACTDFEVIGSIQERPELMLGEGNEV